MRAFHWRLAAVLTPIALAIAACADPTGTGAKGVVTLAQRGTKSNVVVTRNTVDTSFGSGVVRGGVSGVTISRNTATANPTAPPVYRTTVNLTIKGNPPGEWHDQSMIGKNIYLVPELFLEGQLPVSQFVTHNSLIEFTTLRRGTYHVVYSDEDRPSNPLTNDQGYKRLDLLGFFVSNPMIFDGSLNSSRSVDIDLFWDTEAEPTSSDSRANDPTHANGEYTTYKDKFRTKPFRGVFINSLPAHQRECAYRFVVSKTAGGLGDVVWQSQWHTLPDGEDFVSVAWNGYSSRSSGPNDAPPEDDPNNRLDGGHYFYCIEFYPTYGRAPNGVFRNITGQGQNFVTNYFGASQWYSFQLIHGTKPNASPKPGATPTPTPRPTTTPSPTPTPTLPPDTVTI